MSATAKTLELGSGNDAALALAEQLAGDEEAFVRAMNLKATALGLRGSSPVDP